MLHDLGEGKQIVEVVHLGALLSSFGKRHVLDRLSSSNLVSGPDLHPSTGRAWRLAGHHRALALLGR